jgi:hypothetical protein
MMAIPNEENVMQKTVRNFVALVVFVMAITGLSVAQDSTYRVIANVPFDFYAGDQQLPAGTYQFEVNYETHGVMLRNKDTGRSYVLLARPYDGEGVGEAVVEFDVIGGTHMLADVKTASAGVNFPEQKALLASVKNRGTVAIVATLR